MSEAMPFFNIFIPKATGMRSFQGKVQLRQIIKLAYAFTTAVWIVTKCSNQVNGFSRRVDKGLIIVTILIAKSNCDIILGGVHH